MGQPFDPTSLADRVALVTGAGRGVGAATARALARAGARVALVDPDGVGVNRTAEEIGLEGRDALPFQDDITDSFGFERLVDQVVDEWGRLDILVNNAGIARGAILEELSDDDWSEVLEVNLRGAMLCTRATVPHMLARGSGRILSAASFINGAVVGVDGGLLL